MISANALVWLFVTLCGLCAAQEEIRIMDVDPDVVRQYLDAHRLDDLSFAPRIEMDRPALRIVDNELHNVREDVYLTEQSHGQDGEGNYIFGYKGVHDAKTERKEGKAVKGSFKYQMPNGEVYHATYVADENGFHLQDNLPQVQPAPVDFTPEVKEAMAKHMRIWNQEAQRNQRALRKFSSPVTEHDDYEHSNQGEETRVVEYVVQPQAAENDEIIADGRIAVKREFDVNDDLDESVPPRAFYYRVSIPTQVIVGDLGRALPPSSENSDEIRYEVNPSNIPTRRTRSVIKPWVYVHRR